MSAHKKNHLAGLPLGAYARQVRRQETPPELVVLWQTEWQVIDGGCGGKINGVWGKLTKCAYGRIIFYVRENFTRRGGGFLVSSNERQGLHSGRCKVKKANQVLEITMHHKQYTDTVAQLVAEADTMNRPVKLNRKFTPAWAEHERIERPRRQRSWERACAGAAA